MTDYKTSALFKRAEQLKRWEESETNKQSPNPRHAARIQFSSGIVFLAACTAGDKEEVQRLLNSGADINTANVDGLTALHQACIDDNMDMVEFLVNNGADVNRGDNEGWTPLHATASCGFLSIARYLLENGADAGAVNYDGELPIDIADSDEMENLVKKVIDEKGIDCVASRKAEVNSLLADTKNWAANGYVEVRDPKTGGTPLHVAAAKGYTQVLQLLLEHCKLDPDCMDFEGWTPLHAAALWGQKEAAALLLKHGADPNIKNYSGQTCMDLVEPTLALWLADAIADAAAVTKNNNSNNNNKRKLSPPRHDVKRLDLQPATDNITNDKNSNMEVSNKVTDGKPPKGQPPAPDTTPESQDANSTDEAPSWRRSASFRNRQNDPPRETNATTSNNATPPDNDSVLRRTHSFENDKTFYQRYRDVTARIKASSCPSIPPLPQSTLAGIELRKKLLEQSANANSSPTESTNADVQARIAPNDRNDRETNNITSPTTQTTVRSLGDKPELQINNGALAATPTTPNKLSPGNIFKNFFKSFVPPVRDEESETQRKAHAKRVRETRRSTQGVTLDEIKSAEQFVKKKAGNGVAPSETSPVKKTNEAEPTPSADTNSPPNHWDNDIAVALVLAATVNAKATIGPDGGERRPSWRLRLDPTNKFELEDAVRTPSPRPNVTADTTITLPLRRPPSGPSVNHASSPPTNNATDEKGIDDDNKDREGSADGKTGSNSSLSSTQAALNVIQRRRRPKRRSTGVGHVDMDDIVNDRSASGDGDSESESRQSGSERTSETESTTASPTITNALTDSGEELDYKVLYEASAAEVRRLLELLNTSEQQLRDARSTISRLTRMSQSSLSENEKREKRAMVRKLSEMEEELKLQKALQAENQRLKDENGALIRVISKLSK